MNKGVEMIIARMESNPEEFVAENDYTMPPNKWSNIMRSVKDRLWAVNNDPIAEPHFKYQLAFLSDEEILAIWAKYQTLLADGFTRRVMQTLLADPAKESEVREADSSRYVFASPTDILRGNYHESTINQGREQMQVAKLQQAYLQHQMDAQQAKQTSILDGIRRAAKAIK